MSKYTPEMNQELMELVEKAKEDGGDQTAVFAVLANKWGFGPRGVAQHYYRSLRKKQQSNDDASYDASYDAVIDKVKELIKERTKDARRADKIQEKYDELKSEHDKLRSEYDKLTSKLKELSALVDKLIG